MANRLLEICNDWQIMRAGILERNPDLNLIIRECDSLIESAVSSAHSIAHRVEWDTREAAKIAAKISAEFEAKQGGDHA
ncbi:hypothetical protein [Pantoea sp. BAV 3049]|uniref:hypothetical protein n=1 Tax=Pantoea sp. BAV 3049 TaxID=2654188 RepID=UPI00131ADE7A|nr:hypothetical protein [Pantoea sp. BAV 3049]